MTARLTCAGTVARAFGVRDWFMTKTLDARNEEEIRNERKVVLKINVVNMNGWVLLHSNADQPSTICKPKFQQTPKKQPGVKA
jgi:hypothetical protein